jgi:hypothetical protein
MPQPPVHASHAARQAAYRKRQEVARAAELRAKGLPALPAIPTMPGDARWNRAVEHARQLLNDTLEEMQSYSDDRTEAWQEGERAEALRQRLDALQESLDALELAER